MKRLMHIETTKEINIIEEKQNERRLKNKEKKKRRKISIKFLHQFF